MFNGLKFQELEVPGTWELEATGTLEIGDFETLELEDPGILPWELRNFSFGNPAQVHIMDIPIVAVNFHPRWVFFADFSLNS